jgi:hypothetical protein
MANQASTSSKLPCELMKFDWNVKRDLPFCLNSKRCKLDFVYDLAPPPSLCFSFHKGNRLLVYIKKDSKRPIPYMPSRTPDFVSFSKECPPGKVRDPVTKRCVTLKTAAQRKYKVPLPKAPSPKGLQYNECKDGKIRDPVTKRCISLQTAMKRNLIKQPKQIIPKKIIQVKTDCKDGKIRDPVTKRCVSQKTAMKRNLIK